MNNFCQKRVGVEQEKILEKIMFKTSKLDETTT